MEIEGRRRNSKLIVEDNYVYVTTAVRSGSSYYHCVEKACRARARRKGGVFHVSRNHNHKANQQFIEHLQILSTCKARAANSTTPLRRIFEEECERHPQGAKLVTYRSIERSMLRARRAAHPVYPDSPQKYVEIMLTTPKYSEALDGEPFFKGSVEDSGTVMVFFASETIMQQQLGVTTEIHVDITNNAVPDMFLQLMTIHVAAFDSVFPCIYVLMTSNTQEAYASVLSFILEHLMPEMNPSFFLRDVDAALSNAIEDKFPIAIQTGCWFHYIQNIRQCVHSLGMFTLCHEHDHTKRVVQSLMALPLLPVSHMMEGIAAIEKMALEEGPISQTMDQLLNYLRDEWVQKIGPLQWSVNCDFRRTNTNLELFHSKFLQSLGVFQSSIWEFTETLQRVEIYYRQDYERAQQGLAISSAHKPHYVLHDRRIQIALNKLETGQYTVEEFFPCTYYATQSFFSFTTNEETVNRLLQEVDVMEDEDIVDDAEPMIVYF